MINVIFVCLGNICRSPMAEAVFMDMVKKAGLADKIKADSAGLGRWHLGEPPHHGTQNILKQKGIPYSGRSRLLQPEDLDHFDYVLAMDRSNLSGIQQMGRANGTVMMFLSEANKQGLTQITEVPDPWYHDNFDEVYDLVSDGCRALLDRIRADHNL